MPDNDSRVTLTGWGGTAPSVGELRTMSAGAGRVAATVKEAPVRGMIVRGLGRSYGDSAQNGGGLVLRLAAGADDVVLDRATSTACVAAGLSIDDLLRFLVPRGYFVPVTPGTRFVTVGGAIASDIHGKNHHVEGSFGSHVLALSLLTADGTVRHLSPDDEDPTVFWATVGGMGLTGIILDATFGLIPIETSRCVVETLRMPDLDALLALMSSGDDAVRYSVAWIDLLAKGAHLGRSVLTRGDHAKIDELAPRHRGSPLAYGPRQIAGVPMMPPISALNHASVAVFNELWYRRAPTHRDGEIQEIGRFFHPLDAVRRWNRLYGPKGFVQYQFVVPFGQEAAMRTVVERLATSGTASFLAVLKQFGAANPSPLSFPFPGWTLALDIAAAPKGLAELLHGLDDVVLAAGGRHYLAKDAHMSQAAFARGYPRLAEWQATRDGLDPGGVFASDQARRLGLIKH